MKVFDPVLSQAERALDVGLARQGVLSGNVANADTPGYKPKDIDFLAAMSQAMQTDGSLTRTDGLHLDATGQFGEASSPAAFVKDVAGGTPTFDGNEVDLDMVMSTMAENAIQYNANSRAISAKLAILKYVVSDGG